MLDHGAALTPWALKCTALAPVGHGVDVEAEPLAGRQRELDGEVCLAPKLRRVGRDKTPFCFLPQSNKGFLNRFIN